MLWAPPSKWKAVRPLLHFFSVAVLVYLVYDLCSEPALVPTSENVPHPLEMGGPNHPVLRDGMHRKRPERLWDTFARKRGVALKPQQSNWVVWANVVDYFSNYTYQLCGPYNSPTNPVVVGGAGYAQLIAASLGGNCVTTYNGLQASSTVLYNNVLASVQVNAGSFMMFWNVLPTSYPVYVGPLTVSSNVFISANVSTTYVPASSSVTRTVLLVSQGASCSISTQVTVAVSNCPITSAGNCVCTIVYYPYPLAYGYGGTGYLGTTTTTTTTTGTTTTGTTTVPTTTLGCSYVLWIFGPTASASTVFVNMWTGWGCAAQTQQNFLSMMATSTGVPVQCINIQGWYCGSLIVVVSTLGPTSAAANTNALLIYNYAVSSLGQTQWLVIFATITSAAFSPYYNNLYSSSSNPALLGLLALLAIPVGILVGIVVYCCVKAAPVCECEPTVCVDPIPPVAYECDLPPHQPVDPCYKMPVGGPIPMEVHASPYPYPPPGPPGPMGMPPPCDPYVTSIF
eukprot:RCo047988